MTTNHPKKAKPKGEAPVIVECPYCGERVLAVAGEYVQEEGLHRHQPQGDTTPHMGSIRIKLERKKT